MIDLYVQAGGQETGSEPYYADGSSLTVAEDRVSRRREIALARAWKAFDKGEKISDADAAILNGALRYSNGSPIEMVEERKGERIPSPWMAAAAKLIERLARTGIAIKMVGDGYDGSGEDFKKLVDDAVVASSAKQRHDVIGRKAVSDVLIPALAQAHLLTLIPANSDAPAAIRYRAERGEKEGGLDDLDRIDDAGWLDGESYEIPPPAGEPAQLPGAEGSS